MKCPNGHENPEGSKFCMDCGNIIPQVLICSNCKGELPLKARFCFHCGTPIEQNGNNQSSGISMGDKNVIAGDVTGHKEEYKVTGNVTIIKNDDESKKVDICHICGKKILSIDGFICPKCKTFTCLNDYNLSEKQCLECCERENTGRKKEYEDLCMEVFADGKIDPEEAARMESARQRLGLSIETYKAIENRYKKICDDDNLTRLEIKSLNEIKDAIYKNFEPVKALLLFRNFSQTHLENEEIFPVYLDVLMENDPGKCIEKIITLVYNNLKADSNRIRILIDQYKLNEADTELRKARKIWSDNAEFIGLEIELLIAIALNKTDEKYLKEAREIYQKYREQFQKDEPYPVFIRFMMEGMISGNYDRDKGLDYCREKNIYPFYFLRQIEKDKKWYFDKMKKKLDKKIFNSNDEKEMEMFIKLGNSYALHLKGKLYYEGDYYSHDLNKAMEWYLKAAEKGNSSSMFSIGNFYYLGTYNVEKKDYDKAHEWFFKAADKGNATAICQIGISYMQGWGVKQDYDIAKEWLRKAVDKGDERAVRHLEKLKEKGH